MQNLAYCIEDGIVPWNTFRRIEDKDFLTVSIIGKTTKEIFEIVKYVVGSIQNDYPNASRVYIRKYDPTQSKVQLCKLVRVLCKGLPGYGQVYVRENVRENYWCQVAKLELPLTSSHLDTLFYPWFWIFTTNEIATLDEIWRIASTLDKVIGEVDLYSLMRTNNIIIARHYNGQCTHTAFQFFAPTRCARSIVSSLEELILLKVSDHRGVADFINSLE